MEKQKLTDGWYSGPIEHHPIPSGVPGSIPPMLGFFVCIVCPACGSGPASTGDGTLRDGGQSTDTEIEEDVTDPRGRLSVSDGKLVDENGARVTMTGLSLAAIRDLKSLGQWNETYFADARSWGAKLVRLPVNPSTYRWDAEQTLRDLDAAATWCENQDLYLIVDYHIIGNVPDGIFQFGQYTSTTWQEQYDFWETVGDRFGDNPTVAFAEVYNEPASMDWLGGTWTFEEWREQANTLIAVVRAHAPEMIPLVAGFDFAYDLSWLGDHPFDDRNVALAVHPYPGRVRSDRAAGWEAAFGYLSDDYPIIITEFGFEEESWWEGFQDDITYGREIVAYADAHHISWAAFVFYRGPWWPMPLFYDWDTKTPTLSGAFFKDVLAGEPLDVAGDGFEEPAEDNAARGNGPSGLWWQAWSRDGAAPELPSTPTEESVSMHIDAAPGEQTGLACFFDDLVEVRDFSGYNALVFVGRITEGAALSITLGSEAGMYDEPFQGCTYTVIGEGEGEYAVDLLSTSACTPGPCCNLDVSQINFLNFQSDQTTHIDISIESLELRENPDPSLPPSS